MVENLDKIIAYKSSDYLRSGATYITDGKLAEAMHALSEGYGFILSLQFTSYIIVYIINFTVDFPRSYN